MPEVIKMSQKELNVILEMDIDRSIVTKEQMVKITDLLGLEELSKDELLARRNGVVLAFRPLLEDDTLSTKEMLDLNAKMSATVAVIDDLYYR